MEAMRKSWTDARLDDLNHRVDSGFKQVYERFNRMEVRFDALQRTIIQVGGGLIGTMILAFGGVIATQL